jgi:hypothetical protein
MFETQTFYYNSDFEIIVSSHPFIVRWNYTDNIFTASPDDLENPNNLIADGKSRLTKKGFEAIPYEKPRRDGENRLREIAPVFELGVHGINCVETYLKK